MHMCIIGWDNGLLPGQCQAIISTSAGISLIWPLGTHLNKILVILIQENAFENVVWEMSAI